MLFPRLVLDAGADLAYPIGHIDRQQEAARFAGLHQPHAHRLAELFRATEFPTTPRLKA